ncbi:MAG: 3'(2'),5'-bisphosphate nucleotidase CysQ [Chloroflexota bacterium]
MENSELLTKVELITREAGKIILGFFKSNFEVEEKSPDNPVTEADKAADSYLKESLMALLPDAGWLSEETADTEDRLDKNAVWIVDPLDGTKEFVMGIPEFSVSVALVEDGLPVLGAIYNPVTNEMVSARAKGGVRINGEPISASKRKEIAGSKIDASRSERKRGEFEPFEELLEVITMGSIAWKLARTAIAKADATWSRGPKHEWDICAGVLLVKEAGGHCVDLDGNEFSFNKPWPKVNGIIATGEFLINDVMTLLEPYRDSARKD